MATRSCLMIVADYPYVVVGDRPFAEIPWDERLARLYQPTFGKILLLGRLRRAPVVPPGWFPVDTRFYQVIDGGDWETVPQFTANLPTLLRALRTNWDRVSVLYLKLFYLESLVAWTYNRLASRSRRKPTATLLVGDAAEAVLLRDDLLPLGWLRRLASIAVGSIIRYVQRRVDRPGFWARFLANRFDGATSRALVVTEPWLGESQIRMHNRSAPRQPCTVLFVGRLVPRKRANLVLDAVAKLVAEGRNLTCMVVGDGGERARLEHQAVETGIAGRVTFTGWVGLLTDRMLAIYDDADILCLPSFAEGVPLVLTEAMGRGVAVVATAVSGTPEAVIHEQSGLLIPRDDGVALVAAIRRYLEDADLWSRCVRGGYEMARRHTFEVQRTRLARTIAELSP